MPGTPEAARRRICRAAWSATDRVPGWGCHQGADLRVQFVSAENRRAV